MTRSLVILCAMLSVSCSALVGQDYPGEPMLEISGNVFVDRSAFAALAPRGELRVALYWVGDPTEKVESAQNITTGSFPSRYSLKLYTPPSDEVLRRLPGGGGEQALGLILLYDDIDRDGSLALNAEPVVGTVERYAVVFTPNAVTSGDDGPVLLPRSYSLVALDLCGVEIDPLQPGTRVPVDEVRDTLDLRIFDDGTYAGPDFNCDGIVDDPCFGEASEEAIFVGDPEATCGPLPAAPDAAIENCIALEEQLIEDLGSLTESELADIEADLQHCWNLATVGEEHTPPPLPEL